MLDYEEELKKFQPSMDLDDAEEAINSQGMTDVIDLLKDLHVTRKEKTAEKKETPKG